MTKKRHGGPTSIAGMFRSLRDNGKCSRPHEVQAEYERRTAAYAQSFAHEGAIAWLPKRSDE